MKFGPFGSTSYYIISVLYINFIKRIISVSCINNLYQALEEFAAHMKFIVIIILFLQSQYNFI